jgi:hypothetical protein
MHRFHAYPTKIDGSIDPLQKRKSIRQDFLASYALFESLFELLRDDTVFYRKSEPTRHPMIFYFGHTAAFYINKLILSSFLSKILHFINIVKN